MEKFVYLNELFDLYGDLLTSKQKDYFMKYYFENLSYGEIAEEYKVSRNAIFRQLKKIEEKLYFYEEILKNYSKKQKINDIMKLVEDDEVKRMLESLF